MQPRLMATTLGWPEEENKNSGPKWTVAKSWLENKRIHTICQYPGCAFYDISLSVTSREPEKVSSLDCLVLLGTRDFVSDDVSVSEPRNRSSLLYKAVFIGTKYLKMIWFDTETKNQTKCYLRKGWHVYRLYNLASIVDVSISWPRRACMLILKRS